MLETVLTKHPTQALLDAFTIQKYKKEFKNLKVAICGDVLHSRVAHSNIKLLKKLESNINIITIPTLITKKYRDWMKKVWNITTYSSFEKGVKDVEVIIVLRVQYERMSGCYIPSEEEYFKLYGVSDKKIINAKNHVIILHPGPINRNVEICSKLADNNSISLLLEQVESGVCSKTGGPRISYTILLYKKRYKFF